MKVPKGRRIMRVIIGLVVAYAALVLLARLVCRSFVFPAPRVARVVVTPGASLVTFPAADGAPVQALSIPATEGARTVVVFHGNGETIDASDGRAWALAKGGLGVLLVEYRGYGASDGAPTEQGLYADGEGAVRYLASRGVPAEKIALWGTSLGTGVVAELARHHAVASIVLVTPYTSMVAVVQSHVPVLPAALVVRDVFDTRAKCAEIHAPALVVHGDADGVVPFWMGKAVAEAISGATFLRVPGGGHNDLFARDPSLLAALVAHLQR